MATAKSRFSVTRLENIIDKLAKHANGEHLTKKSKNWNNRKGVSKKFGTASALLSRRNSVKMRGG